MEEKKYSVELIKATRELSKRELVSMSDFSDAIKLDSEIPVDEAIFLTTGFWATFHVVNPNVKNNDGTTGKEYDVILIETTDGTRYVTGSPTLARKMEDFRDILADEGNPITVKIYKRESNNYRGKYFITARLM